MSSEVLATSGTFLDVKKPICLPSSSIALSLPATGPSPKAILSNSLRTLSSRETACKRRLASFSFSSSKKSLY